MLTVYIAVAILPLPTILLTDNEAKFEEVLHVAEDGQRHLWTLPILLRIVAYQMLQIGFNSLDSNFFGPVRTSNTP
jgi:hypothetical protein